MTIETTLPIWEDCAIWHHSCRGAEKVAVRERDVLQLGASCGDLIVRGLNYQQHLTDGAFRALEADAGVGYALWCFTDPGDDYCEPVQMFTAGAPKPTPAQVAGLLAAMPEHPLGQGRQWLGWKCMRMSQLVRLPAFWETPQWTDVHGFYGTPGRYPTAVQFGPHSGRIAYLGLHRERNDYSDDDMPLLELLSDMLRPALAFRSSMDAAAHRLRKLDGGNDPERALTQRESEVLCLVARGWTSVHIGTVLSITERTVRKHLANANEKLGVSTRAAAAAAWAAMNSDFSRRVELPVSGGGRRGVDR
jgi:DNA-binding CsgD family transcriptional regulator